MRIHPRRRRQCLLQHALATGRRPGITVVVATGDHGSAGCDAYDAEEFAGRGLAVSGFASTPYNIAVGGTDFDQSSANFSTYWNVSNAAATQASAKSYIPETTWNQSCAGMAPGQCTSGSNKLEVVGGGGGPSSCSLSSTGPTGCTGYPKPSWQFGPGVPSDGVRDLPDVSLFSSDGFNSSFYIMCEEDANGFLGLFPTPCSLTNQTFVGLGGTSAAAPTFAAILALVNQKQGANARQGNANYLLYKLAAQAGASCNSSTAAVTGNSCSFYDITKGNTSSPCYSTGSPNCGYLSTSPIAFPVLVDPNNPTTPAWLASPGYDRATGLGSVNAYNLVNHWSAATLAPTTTTLTTLSPTNLAHGQTVNVVVSVAPASGTGTPTGAVSLIASPAGQSNGIADFPLSGGLASGTTTLLPGGTYNVSAHCPGDSTFGPSDSAPIQVTVGKENSLTTETLVRYDPINQSYTETNNSTVPYGSAFYLRDDVTNTAGTACGSNSAASCPTGSVTFTSNGTFALNNLGYALEESLELNFAIGSYTFQSQYSGDNSFNPSSTTINATVTRAPTSITVGIPGAAIPVRLLPENPSPLPHQSPVRASGRTHRRSHRPPERQSGPGHCHHQLAEWHLPQGLDLLRHRTHHLHRDTRHLHLHRLLPRRRELPAFAEPILGGRHRHRPDLQYRHPDCERYHHARPVRTCIGHAGLHRFLPTRR